MVDAPETVEAYLESIPEDRRVALEEVRKVILKNLPKGYEEGIQYRMIGYFVPHHLYPAGYHCDATQPLPYAHLANQKNYMSIYLFCIYGNAEIETWFREEWAKTGLKLDMGKSCIRFKKLEDLPLKLIGQVIRKLTVKKYIAAYESNVARPTKKSATKKSATKKVASKKVSKGRREL